MTMVIMNTDIDHGEAETAPVFSTIGPTRLKRACAQVRG